MILDSSAIVAILLREAAADELEAKVAAAAHLEGFLQRGNAVVVSFSEEHAREAAEAFARFGKGRHRSALNFGDCMSYAVAKLAR